MRVNPSMGTAGVPPAVFPCAVPAFLDPEDGPLWQRACLSRQEYWAKKVFLRGIVEISNHCRQNCLYCGLRRDNILLRRYRMAPDAVFEAAASIKQLGFGTVVLQAGEDPGYPARAIAGLVTRVKKELGLAVTLSLGEWGQDEYTLWRESGADRYLLKLETADQAAYARLRPDRTLEERVLALRILTDLGYETGSGLITGLPGDSEETLSQGLSLLSSLKLDMVSLGPFTPHPDTPLKGAVAGSIAANLRAMARARVLMPSAHIPVTSALGLHGDEVRLAALEVGNVLMPSLTPENVRGDYAIYPGKNRDMGDPAQRAAAFRPLLRSAGFVLPSGPGGAWRPGGGI